MDRERFIRELKAAVPEATERADGWLDYDGTPLTYIALPDVRVWLEENALDIRHAPLRAAVRPAREGAFRRFWEFVEAQAANADRELQTLLAIELFEGVWWTEDVMEYLGPHTRALLDEARVWLAPYNGAIGRRPPPRRSKKAKPGRPTW